MSEMKYLTGQVFKQFFCIMSVFIGMGLILGGALIIVFDFTDTWGIPYWYGIIAFVLGWLIGCIRYVVIKHYW